MLCINANKPGSIANKVQNSIPPIENHSKFSTTTAAQGKTKTKTKKRLSSEDGPVNLPTTNKLRILFPPVTQNPVLRAKFPEISSTLKALNLKRSAPNSCPILKELWTSVQILICLFLLTQP
jgi:hypothetical protein